MSDIVERARSYARNLGGAPEDYLVWQLADEIERLRAALQEARRRLVTFAGDRSDIKSKKEAILQGIDLCQWELLRDIDRALEGK